MASGPELPHGGGRHLAALRDADDVPDAPDDCRLLAGDPPGQGIHDRLSRARDDDPWRLSRARPRAVLPLPRGGADPDVPDHRHLGRQGPHLRHVQVLPLHLLRFGPDADRHGRDVRAGGHDLHRRLRRGAGGAAGLYLRRRYDPGARHRHRRGDADADVAGLLHLLRRQDADVALSHLAAGCACAGANGRIGRARRSAAEARRLWLSALQPADVPGRLRDLGAGRALDVGDRHRLCLARGAGAERH